METIEIQTRDYSFRVSKEWAEKYFERKSEGSTSAFQKEDLYTVPLKSGREIMGMTKARRCTRLRWPPV